MNQRAEIIVRDADGGGDEWTAETRSSRDPRLADRARHYRDNDPSVTLVGIRIGGFSEIYTPEQVEQMQAEAEWIAEEVAR